MIGLSAAVRYVPAPALAAVSDPGAGFDPLVLASIVIGLGFGSMWRAAMMRSEKRPWQDVRDDLLTSALAGGANGALALFLTAWWLEGGVLVGLGVGTIVSATGVAAIQWAQKVCVDKLQRMFGGSK